MSCLGYHALLDFGKDIPLTYVFKHIFLFIVLFKSDDHNVLSIVLFKLSRGLYDLSSNDTLLI